MCYTVKIIHDKDYKTSNWSGGTTTELAIYPVNSDYKNLDFKWRLSSAKVELEESTFTYLPNTNRFILSLDNPLKLQHDNNEIISLNPFEVHNFSGEWNTKSFGKVRDFNLMLKENSKGYVNSISLSMDTSYSVPKTNLVPKTNEEMLLESFYVAEGACTMNINNGENIELDKNDLLLINVDNSYDSLNITINGISEKAALIRSTILYRK
ncbi:HutD family protein [Clostridium sp. UBA6640]|uniref:HutD/Ves family protein n=1 Tax=Clostridium sp. UBA6640 TaxID=1946370 RepID=UPI0025C53779|nr:HutD family protein [Clostridium sp. UBA6640]